MMTKIIGSGVMNKYSQEINLQNMIRVSDLVELICLQDTLRDNFIIVRNHRKLSDDDLINILF